MILSLEIEVLATLMLQGFGHTKEFDAFLDLTIQTEQIVFLQGTWS